MPIPPLEILALVSPALTLAAIFAAGLLVTNRKA
jgi:hypothetical protein